MTAGPKLTGIRDLLQPTEVQAIDSAPLWGGARHPTWYPIFYSEGNRPVDHLTNLSVRIVAEQKNGTIWLESQRPRLTDLDDPGEASSALAEIRAYGAWLEAGFKVRPIPTSAQPTPDFEVDAGDGSIAVEVFAKHQDDQQAQLVEAMHFGAAPLPAGVERSIIVHPHVTVQTTVGVLQPGGAPDPSKPQDSVQANLISRVCGAKGGEEQIPPNKPALLWIDFNSFGPIPEVVSPDQMAPLISGHHGMTSGALWYAFYGWKSAPIFEEDFFPRERIFRMGHDGRFRLAGKKKSKLSGAILVLPTASTLLENPWSNLRLPELARRMCERLPWFDLSRSVADWSQGEAMSLVDIGRRRIESMEAWREKLSALD